MAEETPKGTAWARLILALEHLGTGIMQLIGMFMWVAAIYYGHWGVRGLLVGGVALYMGGYWIRTKRLPPVE